MVNCSFFKLILIVAYFDHLIIDIEAEYAKFIMTLQNGNEGSAKLVVQDYRFRVILGRT